MWFLAAASFCNFHINYVCSFNAKLFTSHGLYRNNTPLNDIGVKAVILVTQCQRQKSSFHNVSTMPFFRQKALSAQAQRSYSMWIKYTVADSCLSREHLKAAFSTTWWHQGSDPPPPNVSIWYHHLSKSSNRKLYKFWKLYFEYVENILKP
jgi:hypothetical protein